MNGECLTMRVKCVALKDIIEVAKQYEQVMINERQKTPTLEIENHIK